jgi:hypothetical protein
MFSDLVTIAHMGSRSIYNTPFNTQEVQEVDEILS